MPLYSKFSLIRCYCPVCHLFLGDKQTEETTVFSNDTDCKVDWIFYPGKKLPKAVFKNKHPEKCGCGCGR